MVCEFVFAGLVTTLLRLEIPSADAHSFFIFIIYVVALWILPGAQVFYLASSIESDFHDAYKS